jgi:hypothetical protein
MNRFSIHLDRSNVFAALRNSVTALRPPIALILKRRRLPKIRYGVVRSVSVNMVNLFRWKFAINKQPREPMSHYGMAEHPNLAISLYVGVAGLASNEL